MFWDDVGGTFKIQYYVGNEIAKVISVPFVNKLSNVGQLYGWTLMNVRKRSRELLETNNRKMQENNGPFLFLD